MLLFSGLGGGLLLKLIILQSDQFYGKIPSLYW